MLNNSRHNKQRQKLLYDTAQRKERFKMYKAGRNWLFAGITVLFFGTGVYMGPPEVSADSTVDTSSVAVTSSSAASESSSSLQSSSSENSETTSAAAVSEAASSSVGTTDSSAASSDSTSSSATSSEATSVDSLATSSSSSNSQETSATSTSEGSSVATSNVSSSETDSSSAVLETSSVSSITSETASSATDSVETRETSNSATSSEAVTSETDQEKLATLGTELPAGTEVTVQSDGSILIALPSDYDDVALVQQVVDDAQLKSAVKITAKNAATLTAPLTYGADNATGAGRIDAIFGYPISMADFAFMQAVGTGTFYNESTETLVTNAKSADLFSYWQSLSSSMKLDIQDSNNEVFVGELNELSRAYYYFIGSGDSSYIGYLKAQISKMDVATAAGLSNAAKTDSDSDWYQVVLDNSEFWKEYFIQAGSGVNDIPASGDVTSLLGRWGTTKPTGLTDDQWKNIQTFINGTVGLYISEIVPGAQDYVLNVVLPAVNTVSDTQSFDSANDATSVLTSINEQSYQLAHKLMTIDGAYSLTTIIPHIGTMYSSSKGTLVESYMNGQTLGEYVGALEGGTATGWDDTTLSGDGVAYSNFSVFNDLYLAYSKAIIDAAYGYAMVGKYDAIQAMYTRVDANGNVVTDGSAGTESLLGYLHDNDGFDNVQTIHNTIAGITTPTGDDVIPTGTTTTTYEAGLTDVYKYILPFYNQKLKDLASDDAVDPTDSNYVDEVWNKIMTNYNLTDTKGNTLTTTYSGEATNDTNPHDESNYVSEQTKEYLVSFYTGLTTAPNTVSYSLQPVQETQYVDSDGNIIKQSYKNLGNPISGLTGTFNDPIDISNLPATISGLNAPDAATLAAITIPESGGVVYIPYGGITQVLAGKVAVKGVNVPDTAIFDYTIYSKAQNSTDSDVLISAGTENAYSDDFSLDLSDGEYAIITPSNPDTTKYAVSVDGATEIENTGTYQISFDDTLNGDDTVTITYGVPVIAAQIKVTETGAPDGTSFTYTVNGGAEQKATYNTDGSVLINANVGDKVIITPKVAGYTLTGTDKGVETKTITVDDKNVDSTISANNTATFIYNPILSYGSKTVSRTVHFEGAGSKTPKDVTQTATYSTVTNEATGEVSYTLKNGMDVAIVTIAGFAAVIGKVPIKKDDDGNYTSIDFSDFDQTFLFDPNESATLTQPGDITVSYTAITYTPDTPGGDKDPEGTQTQYLHGVITEAIDYSGASKAPDDQPT
ncbi:KxYKxGKxW signal peptide domain-containing protein, partial [Pediococcus ethanolidurans]